MKKLEKILKKSITANSNDDGLNRLQELCSSLSIYSIDKVVVGEGNENKSPKTRLEFINNLEINVTSDILCSFLLFDAIKIGLISSDNIHKFLMLCCKDLITTDRIIYFSKVLSSIDLILCGKNQGLIPLKSLSILYELDLVDSLNEDVPDEIYLKSITNYLDLVSSHTEDIYTEKLKIKVGLITDEYCDNNC